MSDNTRKDLLQVIANDISLCTKCELHKERTNTVPGEGDERAKLVLLGEGPGAGEDQEGRPFIGRAGKLLTVMIERMGLKREDVYILNICKCRPPGNRTPEQHEVDACLPYLKMQLKVIDPKVVVAMGACATNALLGPGDSISKRRGGIYHIDVDSKEITVIPTFHPAYLLRNPAAKQNVAQDLALVNKLL